jgi:hypothetical protein
MDVLAILVLQVSFQAIGPVVCRINEQVTMAVLMGATKETAWVSSLLAYYL